jgi:hypothetical protein
MRKTGMVEFQWTFGDSFNEKKLDCTTVQFNKWMHENEKHLPGFKITHMQVTQGKTISKSPMETMFIVFEYDA